MFSLFFSRIPTEMVTVIELDSELLENECEFSEIAYIREENAELKVTWVLFIFLFKAINSCFLVTVKF